MHVSVRVHHAKLHFIGTTFVDGFPDFAGHPFEIAGMDQSGEILKPAAEGFGVHTFRLVNAKGTSRFVKFHWKPIKGVKSLVWDEAQKISGKDPDFHRGATAYDRLQGDPEVKPNPTLAPIVGPPFYALKMVAGDSGSFAGLRTDQFARDDWRHDRQ